MAYNPIHVILSQRYLYQQLQYAYNLQKSIFEYQEDSNLCKLKDGVSFHLFTSHTPCEFYHINILF